MQYVKRRQKVKNYALIIVTLLARLEAYFVLNVTQRLVGMRKTFIPLLITPTPAMILGIVNMAKSAGIKVVMQKKDYDCGIAAMAMLVGVPYGDVSAVCRELYGTTKPNKRGLLLYHMEEIGERLGMPLERVYKAKNYLSGKTGILGMNGGKMDSAGHWVVLKDGDTILDPDDGSVYKIFDYVEANKCRPATILIPRK